jgi:SAM-dependent methyltransferase
MSNIAHNTAPFNADVVANDGYIYTTNLGLSSRMATDRTTALLLRTGRFRGKRVLDMGCGDGFYTFRFWDKGKPSAMVAVDAAEKAVEIANRKKGSRDITFEVGDAHCLPYPDNSFDLVLIQSILHHDDDPLHMIKEGLRLAPEILIHEPNGNNPGVKLIEKISPYHREHGEKSYSTPQLFKWIEAAGAEVTHCRFGGLVPMFCSDPVAKVAKAIEPVVERISFLAPWMCAVYVVGAKRKES